MDLILMLFLMQSAPSQADKIRAAMAGSLAQQRESVAQQLQAAGHMTAFLPMPVLAPAPCEPIPETELAQLINSVAPKQNVDAKLVREVMRQESGFRPCVVSPKGAAGLMQLMPATQAQFQVSDPFSPAQNVEAGTKLLRVLLDRYKGDLSLTLSAYNAGTERVESGGKNKVPDIPETKNYVYDILHRILNRPAAVE
jgi:soluble lytic murein transglycosylase-like protein